MDAQIYRCFNCNKKTLLGSDCGPFETAEGEAVCQNCYELSLEMGDIYE